VQIVRDQKLYLFIDTISFHAGKLSLFCFIGHFQEFLTSVLLLNYKILAEIICICESGASGRVNGGGNCECRRNVGVKQKIPVKAFPVKKRINTAEVFIDGKKGLYIYKSKGGIGSRNSGPLKKGCHIMAGKY